MKCQNSVVQNTKSFVCFRCSITVLPFAACPDKDMPGNNEVWEASETLLSNPNDSSDTHLQSLIAYENQLRFMHINTQSMVSTFDQLLFTINRYPFEIIAMSEIWLNNNPLLLEHVKIPGYIPEFRNRNTCRGGGVGAYIKETIRHKRRKDIENLEPELETLWLEIAGRNKNSSLLFGVIYRSNTLLSSSEWIVKVESLFGHVVPQWDGLIVITGDKNIDLLKENDPLQKQYNGVLEALNLNQHVTKATGTTTSTSTLIDHIISNNPSRITYTDVLPCDHISDNDAPYACINIRVNKFQPRFKYIRNEKKLSISDYVKDFSMLPLSLIYCTDRPDDMVDLLSRLMTD